MKKFYWLSLLLLNTIFAQQVTILPDSFKTEIDTSALLRNASLSLFVNNTNQSRVVVDYSGSKVLAPASNLKVVTSAVGLEKLGEDFTFDTKFFIYGSVDKNGILDGGLYFLPSGDPTFASTFIDSVLSYTQILDTVFSLLKQRGISAIRHAPVIDFGEYSVQSTPDYWPYIDIGNYYGAGIQKFTIHDNMYYVFFKPGDNVGDDASVLRVEPDGNNLIFQNYMKTGKPGSGDNGYIYPLTGKQELLLQGTIPAGVDEFSIRGTMPDPAMAFCLALRNRLHKGGIMVLDSVAYRNELGSRQHTGIAPLIEFVSPPLKEIVRIINKRSINLYTEQLLAAIGAEKGEASTDNGITVIREFFKEHNIFDESLRLGDGSGLSRTNMISAKSLSGILDYMTKSRYFKSYYNSFPVAGDTTDIGGFKRYGLGTAIEKNARIKSGTINGVRAFTGYIHNKKGELLTFSFLVNNYNGRSAAVDNFFKKLLLYIYDAN